MGRNVFYVVCASVLAATAGFLPVNVASQPSLGRPESQVVSPTQASPGRTLRNLVLSRDSVVGGRDVSGQIFLDFAAPRGGTRVFLWTDRPCCESGPFIVIQPPSLTIPQRRANATFKVETFPATTAETFSVYAQAGGVTKKVVLQVQPPSRRPSTPP